MDGYASTRFAMERDVAGIFGVAARFNHACCPSNNVAFTYDNELGCMVFVVCKEYILPGEELTICYGDSLTPRLLYEWYGFRCSCGTCDGLGEDSAVGLKKW